MAQDTQQTDWIEWQGGEMPVSSGTTVHARLRGVPDADWPWMAAEEMSWVHLGGIGDIIAYRVVQA